jgi:sulfonate transport system permease protein
MSSVSVLPSVQSPRAPSKSRNPALIRALIVPVLLIAVWALVTHLGWVNKLILVKPEKVVTRFLAELRSGDLVGQLLASLRRDLVGFALGSVVGLLVGGVMGLSGWFDRLLGPSFHAAKQVAIFAWVPLISVWFGNGETAKVVFIGLAAFYPVVLNTHEGIRSVAREHIEVARAYVFTPSQIVRRVILPSALPSIFAGVHLALIYAWLGTIGAEYLLAPGPGIGYLMIEGRESFAMDKVLLGILIAGAVGAGLNGISSALEARLLKWRTTGLEARS